jgi:hypothetical protein
MWSSPWSTERTTLEREPPLADALARTHATNADLARAEYDPLPLAISAWLDTSGGRQLPGLRPNDRDDPPARCDHRLCSGAFGDWRLTTALIKDDQPAGCQIQPSEVALQLW